MSDLVTDIVNYSFFANKWTLEFECSNIIVYNFGDILNNILYLGVLQNRFMIFFFIFHNSGSDTEN